MTTAWVRFFITLLLSASLLPSFAEAAGVRVLHIIARPQDELCFAASAYRLSQELSDSVDLMVLTQGESDFGQTDLAQKIYGLDFKRPGAGRAYLPSIRKRELISSGRIQGIREHYFLNQRDEFSEAGIPRWDAAEVARAIINRAHSKNYDYIVIALPSERAQNHQKAGTHAVLQAIQQLSPQDRPVVVGCELQAAATESLEFDGKPADFSLERAGYRTVVSWVQAEHKSQGALQVQGAAERESFWVLEAANTASVESAAKLSLFERLAPSKPVPSPAPAPRVAPDADEE